MASHQQRGLVHGGSSQPGSHTILVPAGQLSASSTESAKSSAFAPGSAAVDSSGPGAAALQPATTAQVASAVNNRFIKIFILKCLLQCEASALRVRHSWRDLDARVVKVRSVAICLAAEVSQCWCQESYFEFTCVISLKY